LRRSRPLSRSGVFFLVLNLGFSTFVTFFFFFFFLSGATRAFSVAHRLGCLFLAFFLCLSIDSVQGCVDVVSQTLRIPFGLPFPFFCPLFGTLAECFGFFSRAVLLSPQPLALANFREGNSFSLFNSFVWFRNQIVLPRSTLHPCRRHSLQTAPKLSSVLCLTRASHNCFETHFTQLPWFALALPAPSSRQQY